MSSQQMQWEIIRSIKSSCNILEHHTCPFQCCDQYSIIVQSHTHSLSPLCSSIVSPGDALKSDLVSGNLEVGTQKL